MSLYKNCGWWKNCDCIFEFSVKSYVTNTKNLSCAKILLHSVIWCPLKMLFFKTFGEILSHVATCVHLHNISNYSSGVLTLLWVRAPGSCLAGPPISPDLVTVLPNYSRMPMLYCNPIHSQPTDRYYRQA